MSLQPKHIYEFGPFRLDTAEHLLLRDGEAVPLTPKAFDSKEIALWPRCGRWARVYHPVQVQEVILLLPGG